MQGGSAAAAFQGISPPQFPEPEQQQLKCPRCDSTNTKFCYYNNYNLSQPRHFCKSCRRYWTKGGSLRNIPVGGSTRKNSKRSKNGTANDDSDPNNDNSNAALTKTGSNPSKRANSSNNSSTSTSLTNSTSTPTQAAPAPAVLPRSEPPASLPMPELLFPLYPSGDQDRHMFEVGGTFSSLLSSNPHFGGLIGILSLPSHHLDPGGPMGGSTLGDLLSPGNGCDDAAAAAPVPAVQEDFLSLQGDLGCWSTGDRSGGDGGAGVRGVGGPGRSGYPLDSDFH